MSLPKNESVLENETLFFDADNNIIMFKENEVVITLTELQSRLIFLLLTGVTKKRDIIQMVWQDNHISITDNNYHQLIYQCRALFTRHGIPSHVLKTIPRHGVKFNYSVLTHDENAAETRSTPNKVLASLLASRRLHWILLFLAMSAFTFFEIIN